MLSPQFRLGIAVAIGAVALAASVLDVAITFAAPQQFDLVCIFSSHRGIGSAYSDSNSLVGEQTHFRVDLAQKTYCENSCRSVDRIARVDREEIVFYLADTQDIRLEKKVNRRSGLYTFWMEHKRGGGHVVWEANCEVARFSGFPSVKF